MAKYWFFHVHLISEDPLKVAEFYEKVLGAKKIRYTEETDNVDLDLGGTMIKIRSEREKPLVDGVPISEGFEHLALRTDNLNEAVEELKANGVEFLQEIETPHEGVQLTYFMCPGGVPTELIEIDPELLKNI